MSAVDIVRWLVVDRSIAPEKLVEMLRKENSLMLEVELKTDNYRLPNCHRLGRSQSQDLLNILLLKAEDYSRLGAKCYLLALKVVFVRRIFPDFPCRISQIPRASGSYQIRRIVPVRICPDSVCKNLRNLWPLGQIRHHKIRIDKYYFARSSLEFYCSILRDLLPTLLQYFGKKKDFSHNMPCRILRCYIPRVPGNLFCLHLRKIEILNILGSLPGQNKMLYMTPAMYIRRDLLDALLLEVLSAGQIRNISVYSLLARIKIYRKRANHNPKLFLLFGEFLLWMDHELVRRLNYAFEQTQYIYHGLLLENNKTCMILPNRIQEHFLQH